MEASTLIRKVHMDCPLCDKTHEVEERKRFAHSQKAWNKIKNSIKDIIGYTDLMYKDGFIPVPFTDNIYVAVPVYISKIISISNVLPITLLVSISRFP